jgi:hypothetical protein
MFFVFTQSRENNDIPFIEIDNYFSEINTCPRGNFFICKLNFIVHSFVRFSYTNFEKKYQNPSDNFPDLSTLSGYFFLMTAIRKIWLMTILGLFSASPPTR